MNSINEEVLVLFDHFYSQTNLGEVVEEILNRCEDLSDAEIASVADILISRIICEFAVKFDELTNCYDNCDDENDLNKIFETFCQFEHLDSDFANTLATAINIFAAEDINEEDDDEDIYKGMAFGTAAAQDDNDNDEDDIDNDNVVFSVDDWKNLSSEERQEKVKNVLRKLANAGADAKNLRPFIKNLDIGDKENPYGIKVGEKVKTFNRAKHRYGAAPAPANYGANEGTILFPNTSGQGHDEDAQWHPLHQVALKHGYQYNHTTPINQRDGSIVHHHTWTNTSGHKIGSYSGDTKWSSKVSSASGHVWTGIGTKALDQHLKNKARRYKLQNNESVVAHTPILENLLDTPEARARVQRYADYLNKNPERCFGVEGSYRPDSPAQDLMEAEKLKAKSDKIFGQGKPQDEWSINDFRSGKPK